MTTKDLVVEASYVGNRGVWWQAPSLLDINAVTPSILAAHGLSLSDPNTITLLSTQLSKVAPATLAQFLSLWKKRELPPVAMPDAPALREYVPGTEPAAPNADGASGRAASGRKKPLNPTPSLFD